MSQTPATPDKHIFWEQDGSYLDRMEIPPLRRCLNCAKLVDPSVDSICVSRMVKMGDMEWFVPWVPLFVTPLE